MSRGAMPSLSAPGASRMRRATRTGYRQTGPVLPPTVIEPGRLIAGRHPCAMGAGEAAAEVRDLVDAGVTLFLDLTRLGELEPYAMLVSEPARYLNVPIVDF